MLYNSIGVSIVINYLSILFGIHSGESISRRLIVAQSCIYILYTFLYWRYLRVHNVEIYADIVIQRRSYLYAFIQLYSSYSAYTEQYALMSLTSILAQTVMWREHISVLRLVNEELVKNG